MYWIIQENIRDEASYNDFVQALHDLGVPYSIVQVIPFSHNIIPSTFHITGKVVVWGSTTLDSVAKFRGWTPGTYLNENFDQRIWNIKYPCLNADAEFYEFCQIPTFKGTKFIRPVHDMKVFAGSVVDGEELENWKESIQRYSDGYTTLRPDTPVSVSSVKDIETEWRYFVVGGKIVTGSQYRRGGNTCIHRDTNVEYEPWTFAQKMVDQWQPAEAFVLDVATMRLPECEDIDSCPTFYDGCNCFECKVIEINCINSAGFYAADMREVIKAIEAL
jgi:hypothetical protein